METLKSSRQFERVRREGRTWACPSMVLNAAPNGQGSVRCGFIAGKKVGGAVERNRARRLIREALRVRLPYIKTGWDLVWIARSTIVEMKSDIVGKEMDELLSRGRLFAMLPHGSPETARAQSRIIEKRQVAEPQPQAADVTLNAPDVSPGASKE